MTTKLHRQVRELHKLIGQPIENGPTIPEEKWVRLRGRLVAEEAFEFLESLCKKGTPEAARLDSWKHELIEFVSKMPLDVDLAEAADALGDLDYVSEGSRIALGIDGEPIADEIHRANMQKIGGGLDEHGKGRKPPDWKPPDIEGCLAKQRRGVWITINGSIHVVPRGEVGYWDILDRAGFGPPNAPTMVWQHRESQRGGSLAPASTILLEDGMQFQFAFTGGA